MHHDSTPPAEGTPARRLRLPAVETLSNEALDAVVAVAKLLLAEAGDEGELTAAPPAAPLSPAPRAPRRQPRPSRLAKWEAQWQADAAEDDS